MELMKRPVKKDRVKELQSQAEKNFALYKERAEKRFKTTDELVASLTAQLEAQKDTVNPSELRELQSKGNLFIARPNKSKITRGRIKTSE